jgi:ribosomal protein S18 acetylase RimI-like enzyme
MHKVRTDLEFRPFAEADAELLGRWLHTAGLGVPQGLGSGAWGRRVVADPRIVCRAAVVAGDPVGFYRLDLAPDRTAELTLIVAPGRRRQGIGRVLLEAMLGEARQRGLRGVVAVVQETNVPALSFFRAAGFEESGVAMPGFVHLARLVHRADRQPPLEISP